jgi:hypothetical protein
MPSDVRVIDIASGAVSGAAQSSGNIGFMGQGTGGDPFRIYSVAGPGAAPFTGGDIFDQLPDVFSLRTGPRRVDAVRIAGDVAGSVSAPIKIPADTTGSATVATGGTPTSDRIYRLKFITAGECGAAQFQLSEDGGVTWGQTYASAASTVANTMPNGATITFTSGAGNDFEVGDEFTFVTLGPGCSNANVLSALGAYAEVKDLTAIFCIEPVDATLLASMLAAMNTYESENNVYFQLLTAAETWPFHFVDNYAVVKVGTGTATCALTGDPQSPGNYNKLVFKATSTGELGTAKFAMSRDGGVTYGEEFVSPATTVPLLIEDHLTYITWTSAAGDDLTTGDTYTVGEDLADWTADIIADFGSTSDERFAIFGAECRSPKATGSHLQHGQVGKAAAEWGGLWSKAGQRHKSAACLQDGEDLGVTAFWPVFNSTVKTLTDAARIHVIRDWGVRGTRDSSSLNLETAGGDWNRIPYVTVKQATQRSQVALAENWIEAAVGATELGVLYGQVQADLQTYKAAGEIENYAIEFDLTQDVVAAGGVSWKYSLTVKGVTTWIDIYVAKAA